VKHAIRTTLLTTLLAAAALPAAAQDTTPDQAEPGRRTSLSFSPGGTSAIGLWRDLSPRMRVGLEVGGSVGHGETNQNDTDSYTVTVGPSVKLFSGDGAIRPYTTVGVYVQRNEQTFGTGDPASRQTSGRTDLGAEAGLGLEWRPATRVAIGAHAGINAYHGHAEVELSEEDSSEQEGWKVGTFSSAITLNLFF
jgi:opacity protein-like surface antigen